jgi:glycine/D-amino acid oxidase-like deaminating enzyme
VELHLELIFRKQQMSSRSILLAGAVILSLAQRTMSLSAKAPSNIVVIGAGIQGTSVAYHLAKNSPASTKITILEAKAPASAASGKGGGFMARSWGDGSPTQKLHNLAFDMYEEIANELGCETYRKLPVLSVSPGYKGLGIAREDRQLGEILPTWLDGDVGRISALGYGDDTAQITPSEFVQKMLENTSDKISVVLGTCTGVDTDQVLERGSRKVVAVKYQPRTKTAEYAEEQVLAADAAVVSELGQDWFQGAVQLPMEGVKSTSIVWKPPQDAQVDVTALFCGEDNRFSTNCK